MGFALGADDIDDVKLGADQVDAIYLGDDLVWSSAEPPTLYSQWDRADPGLELNPGLTFTMGTVFHVYDDIVIHGVRIFGHAGSDTVTGRKAHLWAGVGGALIDDVAIDDAPWTGWRNFLFDTPIAVAGQGYGVAAGLIVLSYTCAGGNAVVTEAFATTGAEANGFGCWMPPTDFIVGGWGVNGNGRSAFGAADTFPSAEFQNSFWGVDILFTLDP